MEFSEIRYKFWILLILHFITLCPVSSETDPSQMSVILNEQSSKIQDFVQIRNPPKQLVNKRVTLEYRCTAGKVMGLEVVSDVDQLKAVKVFQRTWVCGQTDSLMSSQSKRVKIRMPNDIAFNYDMLNKIVKLTSRTKLRAWIVETPWWPSCYEQSNCYTRATVRVSYETDIPPPYSRPYLGHLKPCRRWNIGILMHKWSQEIPKCPVEKEIVEVIQYPVVLGGKPYGVYRQFKPYTSEVLESIRQKQLTSPRFTVSIWLYILEYCPKRGGLCSIFNHVVKTGEYRTMLLFLQPDGKCFIQVSHVDGTTSAAATGIVLPLHQWIRVVLWFNMDTWNLHVNFGPSFNETLETRYQHPGEPIYMDDTEGLFIFGGSEYQPSFRGYIGQTTWYRNRVIDPKKIAFPSPFHPMFELKLTRREVRCKNYIDWMNTRIVVHRAMLKRAIERDSCVHPFVTILRAAASHRLQEVCIPKGRRHSRHWAEADRIVRKMVWSNLPIKFETIADQLYANATVLLDEGLDAVSAAFPLLKQAACYGSGDAMYTVSVILNNGIHVKADEIQSQAYLMLAALDNHRLSCLALGHKHRYGLDNVPVDLEQSYMYVKYVADTTREDKELHKDTDVYTESVRLTDEEAIREQTDEDGDIFHWLKHQAKQGVLSAQNKVGRALFWGSQGLKRNVAAATEYFKMSAETGDSQSQYDYGIVLLRGQGTEKNPKEGLKQLQKSADQKNPHAINAIGWYAKTYDGDYQKAAEYFTKAYAMGNPEAAYNLGIMHLYGQYPGQNKNSDKALEFFDFAGTRGHVDAGVGIAYLMIKGTDSYPRNVFTAVEWARFIAEKNPAIGHVLRKGIKMYRQDKRDVSLFYYMLAADAGVEVGSFNVAWLCEENLGGVVSFIEKNCVWRLYNLTTQRELQNVDPYALIKMGDYFWYGCEGVKDKMMAMKYYSDAISKGDPHALFNLGFMVEEGVRVPRSVLDYIRVPEQYRLNNVTLLEYLYTRCKESRKSEAYIPCSIALWKIQLLNFWTTYQLPIKLSSVTGVAAMTALSVFVILRTHLRTRVPDTQI